MKTLKHNITALFVFSIFFVGLPQGAKAQYYPPDSCLNLVYPVEDSVHANYDSVKFDTCYLSETYNQWYANKYRIQFKKNIYMFKQKPISLDSLYTWRDIDSIYIDIQNIFQQLENKYGTFFFKRDSQDDVDSSHLKYPFFHMFFDNYICADSLFEFIRNNISSDSLNDISLIFYPTILGLKDINKSQEWNKMRIINNN